MKRIISTVLILAILLSMSVISFATGKKVSLEHISSPIVEEDEKEFHKVVVDKDGIYIDGVFHSPEEFEKLLEQAQELTNAPESEYETQSALALVAGTWWIPGLGQVVITAAGVIIIAGITIAVGSWIYRIVSNWLAKIAFGRSAKNAVNNCDSNKRNHIMQQKHNWNHHNKNPKWSNIAPLLIKVLQDGAERYKGNGVFERSMYQNGYEVVVRFIKDAEGMVKAISTAFSK
jgi:hypothetical protein